MREGELARAVACISHGLNTPGEHPGMLIRLLVMLIASGMFAGALALGRASLLRLLLGPRPRPSVYPPVPASWRSLLASSVPLAARHRPAA